MTHRPTLLLLLTGALWTAHAAATEPPCDKYAAPQQARCEKVWKQLNQEAVADISRFGLAQLKRRQDGQLSPEQHLKENMEFIKQSTDKRLKTLADRMAQGQEPPQGPTAPPPPRPLQ